MKEETLTIEFAGASVSIEQLESLGWKNLKKKIQYGLTKKDGDWVLKLEPAIPNDSDAPELRILLI